MREENPSETRPKASKFSDQNQPPKPPNQNPKPTTTTNSSKLRSASSWGSQIVKNLAGEKKPRASAMSRKQSLQTCSDSATQKSTTINSQARAKRSLIGDLACSVNPTQVHPQSFQMQSNHRRQSSRDLFNELDHLRTLLQDSKEREFKLQAELSESKRDSRESELEGEVDFLKRRVEELENEKACLSEQLLSGSAPLVSLEKGEENIEMEIVELRRLNKELQLQKRNTACRLASLESQLASTVKASESDNIAKIKAEASLLRRTNEDLCKQVEGLQMSRLNEVEELAYLRWVNSCLRNELRGSALSSNSLSSPSAMERSTESTGSFPCQSNEYSECDSSKRVNLIKKLKKWPLSEEDLLNLERPDCLSDKNWVDVDERRSPRRRHSISGSKCITEELLPNKRRQSDAFISAKEMELEMEMEMEKEAEPLGSQFYGNCHEILKLSTLCDVEKRTLRIPNPPPRPSCSVSSGIKEEGLSQAAPPPPPPPPPFPPKFAARSNAGTFQRAPQVVEFYHSLMKRDSRKDSLSGGICDGPDVANVRSSMIGEIENRSSHLLAIKADVETQGEFVNSLIREVNDAVYRSIEDVVEFVKWLDDELCFLVDERAVLKHFDWPERKADTLREAAFGYKDIKRLESEVSSYKDDPLLPCDIALKKLLALSEKMERTVYNLLRTKETTLRNCKEFQIPTDWMLDNGIISKIKIGSVKLAKMYMKRVAMELQSKAASEKDPAMDYMLLQGVRFAFRIHQFAGGFDAETMHAFEELRNLAHLLNKK